jgi:hypothetical protein
LTDPITTNIVGGANEVCRDMLQTDFIDRLW